MLRSKEMPWAWWALRSADLNTILIQQTTVKRLNAPRCKCMLRIRPAPCPYAYNDFNANTCMHGSSIFEMPCLLQCFRRPESYR